MLAVNGELLFVGVVRLIRQTEARDNRRKLGGIRPDRRKLVEGVLLFLLRSSDRIVVRVSPEQVGIFCDKPVFELVDRHRRS